MIFNFGEYELDLRLYELRAAGERRSVEPQVFDVLAYLIRNRDRVVPKAELLENVWPDRFVSEAALTSRLMAARKALGDTARKQEWIKTIHGRGYRFVGEVTEVNAAILIARETESVSAASRDLKADRASGDYVVAADAPQLEPLPNLTSRTAPPIVGRSSELNALRSALGAAAEGERQIVFVTGEAGAGKTTLIDTFLKGLAPELHPRVAIGQCLEHRGTGEPYLPVLEALERLCRCERSSGSPVSPLIRRMAPSWAAQMACLDETGATETGEASRERMLREMGSALDAIATDVPLILVLEDLHWSDYSTLDLVTTVAQRRDPAKLMIVGTYRPADVLASKHPIYALTQELRIRGRCRVVALPLFETSEIEQYVEAKLPGASFGRALAGVLHQRTAGNALFVGTLIDSWLQQDLIRRTTDGWSLVATERELLDSVPDTLAHLIEQHISELPDEQQAVLESASVAGREFSAASVAAAVGADEAETEAACARLAREGRFLRAVGSEPWPDGTVAERFTFTHDLYADVLYNRIPGGRRAKLHAAIGLRLESALRDAHPERASELAHHFTRGRDAVRAIQYQRAAAEQALRRSAHHEAIEHLEAALEALSLLPDSSERKREHLWLTSRLAPSIVATRGWGEARAEELFLQAAGLARELGETAELSTILYGLATMYEFRGDFEKAQALMEERLTIESESAAEALLETHELLTCSLMHQARYDESIEHATLASALTASAMARDGSPPSPGIQSCGWASASLMFLGLPDAARARAEEVRTLASRSRDDLSRAVGFLQAAFIGFYRREPEQAAPVAEEAIAIGMENRYPFAVGVGRILRGWCMAELGEPLDQALVEIRSGLRTCRAIGARMDFPLFLTMHAEVALRADLPEDALEVIEEAVAMVDGRQRAFFYTPEIWRVRGVIAENVEGDSEAAADWYRKGLDLARQQRSGFLALRASASLVRLRKEERSVLEESLRAMTEGLDTRDVRDARELLGDVIPSVARNQGGREIR